MSRMFRSFLFLFVAAFASTALAATAVKGTYKANGQGAKLEFALAYPSEPFSDNPTTQLVFTEKDASAEERPDIKASFGDFGNALVVKLMKDGDSYTVIGCEFGHLALKHMGASAIGIVEAKEVKVDKGRISGHLVSASDAEIFDEPVVVDLTFDVALTDPK